MKTSHLALLLTAIVGAPYMTEHQAKNMVLFSFIMWLIATALELKELKK